MLLTSTEHMPGVAILVLLLLFDFVYSFVIVINPMLFTSTEQSMPGLVCLVLLLLFDLVILL
jgi:hypothetical protein